MTGADFAGSVIVRLLERRYGAPFSAKWWAHEHAHHDAYVTLECPHCDVVELAGRIALGIMPPPMSYNDTRAVWEAYAQQRVEPTP